MFLTDKECETVVKHRRDLIEALANLRDAVVTNDKEWMPVAASEASSLLDSISKEIWGMDYRTAVLDTLRKDDPQAFIEEMMPRTRSERKRFLEALSIPPKNARNV